MKRIWFGAVLLVILLILGIISSTLMEHLQQEQVARLDRAAELVTEGDWAAARALASEAKQEWDRTQLLIAALCDHQIMDHVEGLFAQMEIFSTTRSAPSFGSTCVYLARQLEALGSSHSFTLENIF